jgi:photosystem II stability/assembly factor-like uncharacterized protein
MGSQQIEGIAFGHISDTEGVLIAVGQGGRMARSFDDGESWSAVTGHGFTGTINRIVFADGRFFAVGVDGDVRYSDDFGTSWATLSDTGLTSISALAYVAEHGRDGVFIVGGQMGTGNNAPFAIRRNTFPIRWDDPSND